MVPIPHIDLDSPVNKPAQSPRQEAHTPKHEKVQEEAPTRQNSPNFYFVNIESDSDSSEEIMAGSEPLAPEAGRLSSEDYPSFEQELVQEIFEKFQNNKAIESPAATVPLEKDDSTIDQQHTNVPKAKHTILPKVTELEVINVLHQLTLPPPNISTPQLAGLSLYQQLLQERSRWDLERKQLIRIIKDQAQQIEEKDNEVIVLQQRVMKVTELIPELMSCRSPSLIYTLFLKEKMINFQLSRIARGLNPSLQTPHDFYATFQSVPMPLQNFLCELYDHNFSVLDNRDWNSLLYVGDVQFRVVMSWIQNEISHETQAALYRQKEMLEPLNIRPEVQNTR